MTAPKVPELWISNFLDAQAADLGAARNTLLAYGRDLKDFLAWLERMAEHVPALAGWGQDEWAQLFGGLGEDLEDTVHATTPDNPERHLAVFAWLLTHAPPAFAARRLGWLSVTGGPGDVAVECWGDVERVFLRLPADVVARLEAQGLVLAERPLART